MKITERIARLAEPVVQQAGCELWDVEYVREGGEWFLRLYLDKPDEPVGIDDCEAVSRAMDPILDREDPIPDSYTFEVCSAGAERVLKRPADFARFLGYDVLVKLYQARDGAKEFAGVLEAYDEAADRLCITVPRGGKDVPMEFTRQEAALVRLRVTF